MLMMEPPPTLRISGIAALVPRNTPLLQLTFGNLGRDPEMRYTPNGQAVTSFSVASSRKYTTSSGEQREETEWLHIR